MDSVLGKDVFDDLQVLKTTLTLTQNTNSNLCVHVKQEECEFHG